MTPKPPSERLLLCPFCNCPGYEILSGPGFKIKCLNTACTVETPIGLLHVVRGIWNRRAKQEPPDRIRLTNAHELRLDGFAWLLYEGDSLVRCLDGHEALLVDAALNCSPNRDRKEYLGLALLEAIGYVWDGRHWDKPDPNAPLAARVPPGRCEAEVGRSPDSLPAPDPQLLKFYAVSDYPSLMAAMEHHIERLQAKLPKDDQPLLTRVRS